ncbi:MAG: hypothetical protein ACE5JP_16265 [Candidatus Bipolaricaulia bacterium]
MTTETGVEIRPIDKHRLFRECERLQREIWGFEPTGIIPDHMLLTAHKNGGLVLGAFAPSGELIGFSFGFPGLQDGKPKLCSHMNAVVADWRGQGIGYRLKLRQREYALSQGLELVTWTFDPLMSLNAYFNLTKLGVISNTYKPNFYGDMRNRLNVDLETDRLMVEWWITSPRVVARLGASGPGISLQDLIARGARFVNRVDKHKSRIIEVNLDVETDRVLVAIPRDMEAIKTSDLEQAITWRKETRRIFTRYLARGFIVTEFLLGAEGEACYLFERISNRAVLG